MIGRAVGNKKSIFFKYLRFGRRIIAVFLLLKDVKYGKKEALKRHETVAFRTDRKQSFCEAVIINCWYGGRRNVGAYYENDPFDAR